MSSIAPTSGGDEELRSRAPSAIACAAVAVLLVGAAVGLTSLWAAIHETWSNAYGPMSHGYLIALMAIWLGIKRWAVAPSPVLHPYWPAAIPFLGVVFGIIVLELLFVNSPRMVLVPLLLVATAALVFGISAAMRVMPACMFLYFALPQWALINEALQELTTTVVTALVALTDVPAHIEGNSIFVPEGVLEIASGCSGLNYLVVALGLVTFNSMLYVPARRDRLILIAAACALALVANWLRVYTLVLIAIATDMQHYLIKVDHLYYGWVVFAVIVGPLLVWSRRFEVKEKREPKSASPSAAGAVMREPSKVLFAASVAALGLLAPRIVTMATERHDPATSAVSDRSSRPDPLPSDWRPEFMNALEYRAVDGTQSPSVELYRASYPRQTKERRLVRPDNDFLGDGWRGKEQDEYILTLGDRPLKVVEYQGQLNRSRRIVWAWYWVAGHPAHKKSTAKLLELRGLLGGRRDAVAVAISAECVPDCLQARERLLQFSRSNRAELGPALP